VALYLLDTDAVIDFLNGVAGSVAVLQLSTTDCLIAAIAVEHQAQLVTGNRRDFPMPEITVVPLPRPGGSTRQ
jgi:predicted nucleic acid-binding protein